MNTSRYAIEDMGANHQRLHVLVAEHLLNGPNIVNLHAASALAARPDLSTYGDAQAGQPPQPPWGCILPFNEVGNGSEEAQW